MATTIWGDIFTRMNVMTRSSVFGAYTPDDLEKTIYDASIGVSSHGSRLLNVHEIIAMQEGDTDKAGNPITPPYLIRFVMDRRAKAADLMLILALSATCITTPITFMWDGRWDTPEQIPGGRPLVVVDLIWDIVYAAYLLLLLNMSFMHPALKNEVVKRSHILQHWLRLPMYWVWWLTTLAYPLAFCGVPLWINNIKLLRAGHLLDLPDSLWRYRDRRWVRMVQPIFLLLAATHWVGCLIHGYGGYWDTISEEGVGDWVYTIRGTSISGYFSLYFRAFTEAMYLLTGAMDNVSGDGGPREKQFGSMVIVAIGGPVGCVVVALFISHIVREQGLAYALSMRHEENKAFMTHAMHLLNIPMALQRRVLSMHYYMRMGHDMEAFNVLFSRKHLSPAMEGALLVYLYRDTVCNSRYFRGKDSNYVLEVLRALQFQAYLPGDYITRRGQVAEEMFFISRGKLLVLIPAANNSSDVADAQIVKWLYKGHLFGEVALLQDDCVRTAWVRAETYTLVSSLHRDRILPIWYHFPQERELLANQVRNIAAEDRKRKIKQKWRKGLEGTMAKIAEGEWKSEASSNVSGVTKDPTTKGWEDSDDEQPAADAQGDAHAPTGATAGDPAPPQEDAPPLPDADEPAVSKAGTAATPGPRRASLKGGVTSKAARQEAHGATAASLKALQHDVAGLTKGLALLQGQMQELLFRLPPPSVDIAGADVPAHPPLSPRRLGGLGQEGPSHLKSPVGADQPVVRKKEKKTTGGQIGAARDGQRAPPSLANNSSPFRKGSVLSHV